MRLLTLAIKLAVLAFAIALLSACGTPYATVANRSGEPVMLLGYDPVAYFTKGEPTRGTAQFKTKLFSPPTQPNTSRNMVVFAPAALHSPSNWAATRQLGKSTTDVCSFLAMF
jgi:hypothetical protein